MSKKTTEYMCYILQSLKYPNRTYVGFTVDFVRRLRQHNGEIKGGAKATYGLKPLVILSVITGFKDKHTALSFEYYLKHPQRKKYKSSVFTGLLGRLRSLKHILLDHKEFRKLMIWIPRTYLEKVKIKSKKLCFVPIDTDKNKDYLFQ